MTMIETKNRLLGIFFRKNKVIEDVEHIDSNSPIGIIINKDFKLNSEIRGHWGLRIDFILSCVGFAVGLGNIWRFPFKVLSYGGGSFIIAYLIMLYTMAMPLFLIEIIIAQFSSRGVTCCWNFSMGMKGIGFSMLLMSLFVGMYYNVVVGWSIYYLVNSLRISFPWISCDNWWNDNKCLRSDFEGKITANKSLEMSSEQFWLRNVITRIETIDKNHYKVLTISDNPGGIVWYNALCMLTVWIICGFVLMMGIKVSGKAMWLFSTFPYFVLTIMIIIGSRLEGSGVGVKFFVYVDFKRLLKFDIWEAAAQQIFFSLGVGFGGMLTFASYNNFRDNIQRDVLLIATINGLTSIYGGFAIFEFMGNMAYRYGEPFEAMSQYSGEGLIFIAYPEILSGFRGAHLLCVLFFLMVFSLGIDSEIGILETVITGILDEFPKLRESENYRIYFVWIFHLVCFLMALIMVTKTGFYWFTVFNNYSVGTNILIVGFFECIVFAYIYGMKSVNRDFKMMMGFELNLYWQFCILVPLPIITVILTISGLYSSESSQTGYGYHKVIFPVWADVLGWMIFAITLLPIPIYLLYFMYKQTVENHLSVKNALHTAFKPNMNWGPGNRDEWLLNDYYKERLLVFQDHPDFVFQRDEVESPIVESVETYPVTY